MSQEDPVKAMHPMFVRILCLALCLPGAPAVRAAEAITCKPVEPSTPISAFLIETMPGPEGKILYAAPKGEYGTIGSDGTVSRATLPCGPGCVDGSEVANIIFIEPIDANRAQIGWLHSKDTRPNENQIASYISEVPLPPFGAPGPPFALPRKDAFAVGKAGATRTPDGTLWFTENWTGGIGRLKDGQYERFQTGPLATADVTVGTDGQVYGAQYGRDSFFRIDPVTKTTVKFPGETDTEYGLSVASSGNAVYGVGISSDLFRVTNAGVRTRHPQTVAPTTIKTAPDGRLWTTTIADDIGFFGPATEGLILQLVRANIRALDLAFRTTPEGYVVAATGPEAGTGRYKVVNCAVTVQAPPVKAPRLTVTLERAERLIDVNKSKFWARFVVKVKNIGDAPTSGTIEVLFRPESAQTVAPVSYDISGASWVCAGLCFTDKVLNPGEEAPLIAWGTELFAMKGTYTFSAVVQGGGSPEARSNKENIIIDGRFVTPVTPEEVKRILGRTRG